MSKGKYGWYEVPVGKGGPTHGTGWMDKRFATVDKGIEHNSPYGQDAWRALEEIQEELLELRSTVNQQSQALVQYDGVCRNLQLHRDELREQLALSQESDDGRHPDADSSGQEE